MLLLTERRVVAFIGICGFLWFPATASSEQSLLEMGPAVPSQEPFALGDLPRGLTPEESLLEPLSLDPEISFEDSFHLRGAAVSDTSLKSRFDLGKRIESQILRPETTFRISSRGDMQDYLGHPPQGEGQTPIDPEVSFEQQVALGFEAAEATVEFLNATAFPLVGSFLSGAVEAGQGLRQVDRRLKKHHLHLRYSNGGPTASYQLRY